MHKLFHGFNLATTLLLVWLIGCAVLLFLDQQYPSMLEPFFTRPLLPSEIVI